MLPTLYVEGIPVLLLSISRTCMIIAYVIFLMPAQVAAFCSVLDKDLSDRTKTSEVDISPLLIQSYSTLINQELERRLKQVPVAFYQDPPRRLFDINSYQDFGISSS
eukprot:1142239-Pelagomonas_calceolata.AAC.3